ncbi:MAG: LURP-one-related/scramblase family protein [Halobacteriaceae archaeon]
MASETGGEYDISTVDLDDDRYTVTQSLIRNKYRATDSSGAVVLQGKQKLFRMKEEFPFVDGDGEPAFTVKAGGVLDIAGSYALVDEGTGEPVVSLEEQWTLFVDRWKVRDPDTEAVLAEITSRSRLVMVLRHIPYAGALFQLLPHRYEITDPDGDHVGTIDGAFSLRDTYEVEIDDASDVPREAVVAAAMVIDAIEGN